MKKLERYKVPKKKYSGAESKEFLKRVNALPLGPREYIHSMGVMLRDIESRVLAELEFTERDARHYRKSPGECRPVEVEGR